MQRPTRQNKMLIGKSMDVPVIPRAFAQGRKFMRLTSAVLLSLATLSVHQTASAVPVTHVFTAITYLSFFGVDGSDEFQMSYTYDTDLVAQGATAGFSRYGPITGNVRADSVTGGFDFDFNVGNTNTEILAVLDNATVLSLPDPADVFSIGFSTTDNFRFGGELLSGFGLSLIDEQTTIFSDPALPNDVGFFAGIDAINSRFNDSRFFDADGFPINSTRAGLGFFVCQGLAPV